MSAYLIRRVLESLPVIFGVSVLVFLLLRLIPGDPATALLGERASEQNVAAIRERLGLEKPLPEQYVIWISRLLQGDLGNTVRGNIPISNELRGRFPATAELALVAITLATSIGVPLGIVSAVRRNSAIDTATMFGALLGVSIPIFVLGLLLIYLFGVQFRLLPFIGRIDPTMRVETRTGLLVVDSFISGNWEALGNALRHLVLPALTLFTVPLAIIARITRSAMLEVLNQDYIRTARAKGLAERPVILRHALRNALLPVITIVGLQLGTLLSGAVLTEQVFSIPGFGKLIVDAVFNRDYAVVQGVVMVTASAYITLSLLADLAYFVINPRLRH